MKVSEYLKKLTIGEIVTNKRLLAALKRKGLIFDYSAHGYLCECSEVDAIYGYDGGVIEYNGSYFTTQYIDGCFCPYLVKCDSKGHYDRRRKMCVWGNII